MNEMCEIDNLLLNWHGQVVGVMMDG